MRRVLIPQDIAGGKPAGGVIHDLCGQSMGTIWSVRLVAEILPASLQTGIQQELDVIVAQMSHWLPDANLGRFNRAAAGSWHPLPPAFFDVLSYSLDVAADTEGAFDPAAGALVNLWGFGPVNRHDEPGFAPPANDIVPALATQQAWRRIELDRTTRSARQPGGALLDFSAIAKGYAVDQLARYLERQGIRHYLVEVGGELRGSGVKPDGMPWWVALEQPQAGTDELIIALHGLAIATSGDYRRYFHRHGRRYAHTIDPRTGYPAHNNVASVTVIHTDCMAADAWSTALTVMGVERGICFAEARCLKARFLVRDGDRLVEHATSGFLALLQ
jgi:FAD:protein FMN transferase